MVSSIDNASSSSSPRDDDDDDSSKKKPVNQNFLFDYSRIPFNSNAHLLSIPLGKPPHFDGECWGPSASEGPQKQDLTVFLEYNV
jgi:hypothetical protein